MSVVDWLKERASKKETKLRKQNKGGGEESCRELERKFLEQPKQFILNCLHQGHSLHFKTVMKILEKR
jgi:hypothetical protein